MTTKQEREMAEQILVRLEDECDVSNAEDFAFEARRVVGMSAGTIVAVANIGPRRLRCLAVYLRAIAPIGPDEERLANVPLMPGLAWCGEEQRVALRQRAAKLTPWTARG